MNDVNVPFAALEVISTRHDRTMKRMCIAFVVAVCVMAICTTIMCGFWCRQLNNYRNNEETTVTEYEQIGN